MYGIKQILKICDQLRKFDNENMLIISLDENLDPVRSTIIATGDRTSCSFTVSSIVNEVKSANCKKFIMSHNHVIGRIDQSEEDDKCTKAVMCKAMKEGLKLIDHIIVKNNNPDIYFSYLEHRFKMNANNELSNSLPDD